MANSPHLRVRISRVCPVAASSALTLATCILVGVVPIPSAQAQTFTVLHSFTKPRDGTRPFAGLIQDAQGNLYGTADYGGKPCFGYGTGCGTVYKLSKSGTLTVLHSFAGPPDGASPVASLIRDAAGDTYGTTVEGGGTGCYGAGCGTVFKISKSGKETVLYSFTGGTADGCGPQAALLRDPAGNLYGTTVGCGGYSGYGIVFKVDTSGAENVLHSFTGSDGNNPSAGVIMDSTGNLYGTTDSGGASNDGVVFKLDTNGTETVLHSFSGGSSDGSTPLGGLIMDPAGNLYGTTEYGGGTGCYGNYGCGTVFKVDTAGNETVLHSFTGGSSDGAWPYAGLARDVSGNLYGATQLGGSTGCARRQGCGAVFKLDSTGTVTLLHRFNGKGGAGGQNPIGGVILDAKGNLYGTTVRGGLDGDGTVWKLTP